MKIFQKKQYTDPLHTRIRKMAETAIKCIFLLSAPVAIATLVSVAWYFFLYRHNINFGGDGMQELIITGWLPMLGIIYAIMFPTMALQTVWTEYKSMRIAVKKYDLDTFMDLRDEELSPLIHLIASCLSLGMLGGFLVLKYSHAWQGAITVFTFTFFFSLMYVVVVEIDDPCSGIWYIKSIPQEWLDMDPKQYRDERWEKAREDMERKRGTLVHQ